MEKETAIKVLKELHDKSLFAERTALETLFPELKESEDERIRREIMEYITLYKDSLDDDEYKSWIAWLENIPYTIDHEKREGFHLGYKAGLEKQGKSYTKRDVDDAYLKGISDAKNELEKQGEQKPAWNEEDEEMCQETIDWFEKKCFPYALENDNPARESIKWLKSLKNRVLPQPKQEWSEEDQNALEDVREAIVHYWGGDSQDILLYWLKSIKQKIKGE